MEATETKLESANVSRKKDYRPPQLYVYGDIRTMTQGTGGGACLIRAGLKVGHKDNIVATKALDRLKSNGGLRRFSVY